MNIYKNKIHKLIIIGTGPAGYTAGIYSARANLNPLLITGPLQGGQLINTNKIENWPGENVALSGFKLMEKFYKQSIKFGIKIVSDEIKRVFCQKKPIILFGKNTYSTHALIIATGASPRYLGINAENTFKNKGISTCAVCDGFFYKKKVVAVVGGGNTAVEEALYLSNISRVVYLIHRNTFFKAEKILLNKLFNKIKYKNIILHANFIVKDIIGNSEGVQSVDIQHTSNKQDVRRIGISGLFLAIGNNPNTEIFENQIKMNKGYISIQGGIHSNMTATNIPGIFAAGDVVDHVYKQAVTASALGCMAAMDAEKYLDSCNR